MPTNNGGRRSVTPIVITGSSLFRSLPLIGDERARNRSDSC